jgi:broad specificity phosphatase PhoE
VRSLILVRHGPTAATRAASFPADEELDARGWELAAALAGRLPRHAEALCAPDRASRQSAAAALLDPRVEPALAGCDHGSWRGRTLEDVLADDPGGAAAWRADPAARPHGGETLRGLLARVGAWLDEQARLNERALAIVPGDVVRAAVVHALGAPPEAFWRIDVAPLTRTELHAGDGHWTLRRVNAALARRG